MPKFNLIELLQQDVKDLNGLHNNLTDKILKNQAGGIIKNLEEHLEEFIKLRV